MRKLSIWTVCVALMLALAVPVLAAGQFQCAVTADVKTAVPGDQVVFTVVADTDQQCTSIGYIPVYDTQVWQITGGECLVEDASLADFSASLGGAVMYGEATVPQGALFCFTLQVKSDAPAGSTMVSGELAANGTQKLETTLIAAQVTIAAEEEKTSEPTEQVTSKPTEATTATEQTQPVPPDSVADPTQATASSEATDATQAIAPEQTEDKVTTDVTTSAQDSTLTIGQGTIPDLGGDDSCVADDGDYDLEAAEPVPKKNDTLLVWIAVIALVAIGAAAAWVFLGKKKTE